MNQNICVACNRKISTSILSFEQRLIGDADFCRSCWNTIMIDARDEEIIPSPASFFSRESVNMN